MKNLNYRKIIIIGVVLFVATWNLVPLIHKSGVHIEHIPNGIFKSGETYQAVFTLNESIDEDLLETWITSSLSNYIIE